MANYKGSSVIKGSGFNKDGGGFSDLIIDGQIYDVNYVAEAVRAYTLPEMEVDSSKVFRAKAYFWKREKTDHWVLALESWIHGKLVNEYHLQPLSLPADQVLRLTGLKAKEAGESQVVGKLLELIKRQNEHIQKLGHFAVSIEEESEQVISQVKDLLSKFSSDTSAKFNRMTAYFDESIALDNEIAKAIRSITHPEAVEPEELSDIGREIILEFDGDDISNDPVMSELAPNDEACCGNGCCHEQATEEPEFVEYRGLYGTDDHKQLERAERPIVFDEFHRPSINVKEAVTAVLLDDKPRYFASLRDQTGKIDWNRIVDRDDLIAKEGNGGSDINPANDNLEAELLAQLTNDQQEPNSTNGDDDQPSKSYAGGNYRQFVGRVNRAVVTTPHIAEIAPAKTDDAEAEIEATDTGYNVTCSEEEALAWDAFRQSEADAYKDKYGIDPKSLNDWKPRKSLEQWLCEKRRLKSF